LKTLEAIVPELFVLRDPVPDWGEAFRDESVTAFAAVAPFGYKTSIKQNAKVLRDGRATHVEVCRDDAHGPLGYGQQIEHPASRPMADRCEHIRLAAASQDHTANMRKQSLTCQVQVNTDGGTGQTITITSRSVRR